MRGRQINFFVMPDEWGALEDYLKENNMISVARKMETKELEISNISEKGLFKSFIGEKFREKIKINYREKPNLYFISETYSPVIEFSRSHFDNEHNLLKRGRFFYTKGYWNDNTEWQEKPEEFLEAADKLFKWFRKTYKDTKILKYKGLLITKKVKENMDTKKLKLQIN